MELNWINLIALVFIFFSLLAVYIDFFYLSKHKIVYEVQFFDIVTGQYRKNLIIYGPATVHTLQERIVIKELKG